ncbi:hypothetical protein N9948_02180, partial [bacterium]|nr:hypothetical protein [bacterium]
LSTGASTNLDESGQVKFSTGQTAFFGAMAADGTLGVDAEVLYSMEDNKNAAVILQGGWSTDDDGRIVEVLGGGLESLSTGSGTNASDITGGAVNIQSGGDDGDSDIGTVNSGAITILTSDAYRDAAATQLGADSGAITIQTGLAQGDGLVGDINIKRGGLNAITVNASTDTADHKIDLTVGGTGEAVFFFDGTDYDPGHGNGVITEHFMGAQSTAVASTDADEVFFRSGDASGTGTVHGGDMYVVAGRIRGSSDANSIGGNAIFKGGDVRSGGQGTAGNMVVESGKIRSTADASVSGNSGEVFIRSGGVDLGTGNSGNVDIRSGAVTDTNAISGNVTLATAAGGATGDYGSILFNTGDNGSSMYMDTDGVNHFLGSSDDLGSTATLHLEGSIMIGEVGSHFGGNVKITSGGQDFDGTLTANTTYNTGKVTIDSGYLVKGDITAGAFDLSMNSGDIDILTTDGQAVNAGVGNSGNINITTGSAEGTGAVRGLVNISATLMRISDGTNAGIEMFSEAGAAGIELEPGNPGQTMFVSGSHGDGLGNGGAALYIGGDAEATGETDVHTGGAVTLRSGGDGADDSSATDYGVSSGNVSILSEDAKIGDAATIAGANSGNITLLTGALAGTGTRGFIDIDGDAIKLTEGGNASTVGYVWTASATDGSGNWEAVSSSSADLTVTMTASGAVAAGAPVYVLSTANDTIGEGDASAIGTARLIGIAETAISDAQAGAITLAGFATIPVGQRDGSFTVGSPVYLSETTGNLTATAPTTSGSRIYQVGIATASDKLVIDLKQGITVA